ncbi:MAG: ABC transporter permease subunit [Chloroflexi bacterium]|nr:ABC transporter permease subunit [Chloroflexota bacterium]
MQTTTTLPAPSAPRARAFSFAWLGVVPFFLFAILFLILPSGILLIGSVQNARGEFTLENFGGLFQESIANSYILSLQLSVTTAVVGGIFGFLLAYAAILGGLPRSVRTTLLTFSGVASNFAGVPLAFAFIATLGRLGFVTVLLKDLLGFDLNQTGFSVFGFLSLTLTYIYFQFPLMVLIIAPALDGLKKEWREAAENLGASAWQYWRIVAFPVLLPSILGTMILLFSNAFGAVATAYALTGGNFPLATILIFRQIRGEVLGNPGLGYAVAVGMVIIMGGSLAIYYFLQRKTERWLKQ